MHETIPHLCLEKTRHGLYVTLMPVESTEMSISFWYGTYRGTRTFTHVLTECLNKREKRSTSGNRTRASYQTIQPGISIRVSLSDAVGPALLSDTYLLPGTAVRERNVGPYDPFPTHNSFPRKFSIALIFFEKVNLFSLSYVLELRISKCTYAPC